MCNENTYWIVDHNGVHVAEVRCHYRLNEELHPIYLQDICESMDAYGYHSLAVKVPELSEFGQLIAD